MRNSFIFLTLKWLFVGLRVYCAVWIKAGIFSQCLLNLMRNLSSTVFVFQNVLYLWRKAILAHAFQINFSYFAVSSFNFVNGALFSSWYRPFKFLYIQIYWSFLFCSLPLMQWLIIFFSPSTSQNYSPIISHASSWNLLAQPLISSMKYKWLFYNILNE